MKQLLLFLLLACTGHSFAQSPKTKNDLVIVIIRHGEKYAAGSNLSCKGLNRALHIPAVINKKFGRPLFIYVPTIKTGATTSQDRMFQTATPLAVADSIPINSQFDETQTKDLADYLKTQEGLQLVVWEHGNIPKLGHHLGLGKDSLSWQGSDFDTIWIVTFPHGRKHAPQLIKTTEGLNSQPNKCPFSAMSFPHFTTPGSNTPSTASKASQAGIKFSRMGEGSLSFFGRIKRQQPAAQVIPVRYVLKMTAIGGRQVHIPFHQRTLIFGRDLAG